MLCLLVAGPAASCQLLEAEFTINSGSPRAATERQRQADTSSVDAPEAALFKPDTTVWVSAVVFPQGYNWQRDTAYGNVDARIVLMRDGEPVLEVPADGAAEAHRHHIVDGHLYSECGVGREKRVRRDGEVLYSMPATESLCGAAEIGDEIYTLTRKSGGRGFVLRCGAQTVLNKDEGAPLGGFDDTSFAPGGALYADAGKCCFAYKAEVLGKTICRLVCDGVEAEPGAAGTQDLKMIGGSPVASAGIEACKQWQNARIWRCGAMSGETGPGGEACVYRLPGGPLAKLGPEGGFVYVSDTGESLVRWTADGSVFVGMAGGQSKIPGTYSVFYSSCASMSGDRLLLALTPRDTTAKTRVFVGDTVREYKVRGFLSGICATVTRLQLIKK